MNRAAAGARRLTFLQYLANTAGASSYTFTSANLGITSPDRVILVCAFGSSGSNFSINSVTLGGNAMSAVVSLASVNAPMGIYSISVATGTSANVVLTFSATSTRAGIAMYSLTGFGTVTTHDTASNTTTAAANTALIDTAANGCIVGFSSQFNNPVRTISSVSGFTTTDVNTITDSTSRVFAGNVGRTAAATNATYGVTYSNTSSDASSFVAAAFS